MPVSGGFRRECNRRPPPPPPQKKKKRRRSTMFFVILFCIRMLIIRHRYRERIKNSESRTLSVNSKGIRPSRSWWAWVHIIFCAPPPPPQGNPRIRPCPCTTQAAHYAKLTTLPYHHQLMNSKFHRRTNKWHVFFSVCQIAGLVNQLSSRVHTYESSSCPLFALSSTATPLNVQVQSLMHDLLRTQITAPIFIFLFQPLTQ